MSSLEILPEEIVLKIFAYLETKDLGRCLQVSKRFRNIAQDESLWNKFELENKIFRSKFIGQALRYGLNELHLEKCRLKFVPLKLPKRNKLQSLYFSAPWNPQLGDNYELEFLSNLISSCHFLKKLIIGKYWGQGSNYFGPHPGGLDLKIIAQNGHTLQVLNLTNIKLNFDFGEIKAIVDSCTELEELCIHKSNGRALIDDGLNYLCRNLTRKMRKLHLLKLQDNHLEMLTKQCNQLTLLSLGQVTVSNIGLNFIIQNLAETLETLVTVTWPYEQAELVEKLPKLKFLYFTDTWHIGKQLKEKFKRHRPELFVMRKNFLVDMKSIGFTIPDVVVKEPCKKRRRIM